jgi:hypothetical protein
MAHIIYYKFRLLICSFKHITKLPLPTKLAFPLSIIGYTMPKERPKYRKYSTNILWQAAKMVCQSTKLRNKWEFRGVRSEIFFLRILYKTSLGRSPKLERPFALTADLEVKLQWECQWVRYKNRYNLNTTSSRKSCGIQRVSMANRRFKCEVPFSFRWAYFASTLKELTPTD